MKGFKADNSHICTAEHVQVKYCYNQTVVRDTFFWSCKIVIIKIMRFLGLVKPKEFCHVKLDIYLTRHKFCNEGFRMNDSEWLLTSYHLGQLCLTLNDVRWKMMLENCKEFTCIYSAIYIYLNKIRLTKMCLFTTFGQSPVHTFVEH